MAILENQSLQYLNFVYEHKVLIYSLKQDIWMVLFSILVHIFPKLRKWRGDFTPFRHNCAHDK